ncbi:MAG: hypothetical protein ACOX5O_10500 [Bacteroidales bacterium]|jgi:hypothetical protein
MKKFTLLITLLLFVVCSFAQKITRGPDVGEIYFLGPTTTILQGAIYHSTDFGETAICMDSVSALSNTLVAMTADKTPGSLYFSTMGGGGGGGFIIQTVTVIIIRGRYIKEVFRIKLTVAEMMVKFLTG